MMLPCLTLLLLAAAGPPPQISVMDEVVSVPPGEWRALPLFLKQRTATVDAAFRVIRGDGGVRLALLDAEETTELRRGSLFAEMASTPIGRQGRLTFPVFTLGEYHLIVDNREGRSPVELQLTVTLLFNPEAAIRYASPQRRVWTIAGSLGFFAMVAGYAGVKLRRAIDQRP